MILAEAGDDLRSLSPWTGEVVWSGADDRAHLAVALDRIAACPLDDRAVAQAGLLRLRNLVMARRAEAIDLLVREAGKTLADAQAEADLLARKIDLTLGPGLDRCPEYHQLDDAAIRWRARGPALVLGPFNFPLHLLHGLVVPALAVGCPVLAKPSERTPALGAWYRQCMVDAGLAERCQVLLGGPDIAMALLADRRIATVAAVGSRRMGQALAAALVERPEVVLALELGGVNHALLCADADLDAAAPVLADGAWRMAGQRCTATRIVHVPADRLADLAGRLCALHAGWCCTCDPNGRQGPLIDTGQRERFQLPWRNLPPGWRLLVGDAHGRGGVAEPLLVLAGERDTPHYTQEHFGPLLVLDPYDDENAALARMQANQQRLSAAVWTRDDARFARLASGLAYGLVARNRSTAGARGDLPFGGCGLSGNGHPAAIAATEIFADETVIW